MTIAATAAEAFDRYMEALSSGTLIQKSWHVEKDGRQLACALGVLGQDVDSTSDCPAQIMPRWLAQMVPWFFDNQSIEDATDWGRRFYSELKRINGAVPFSVVYDWHATVVCPFAIEVAEKRKRPTAPHEALQVLHQNALSGERADREEWRLKLRDAYAYVDVDVYADAYANANAYADAYADADANAYAYVDAYVDAYADANAYVDADADADADANAYQKSIKRLADGMVACLARVPSA